jgi:two-component system sensor histidine kinase UhpB
MSNPKQPREEAGPVPAPSDPGSKRLFAAFMSHLPGAAWVKDLQGRYVLANGRVARNAQRELAELLGKSDDDLWPVATAAQFKQSDRDVIESGEAKQTMESTLREDGLHHLLVTKFPILNEAGALELIGGVALDVTERKLAEEKLKAYAQQLQTLSQRLVETQENERGHIARELHDEIGQALTAIQINLQSALRLDLSTPVAQRLQESLKLAEDLLQKTQDLSLGLRPSLLDDLGLPSALRWYANLVASRAKLRVEFWAGRLDSRLDPEIETACFRVAQEALTNVVRHAQAAQVTVELRREDEALHLVVHDDGMGFDVAGCLGDAQRGARLGLVGMQERVALAGGRFECKSNPQQGTEVHAWFPLRWRG